MNTAQTVVIVLFFLLVVVYEFRLYVARRRFTIMEGYADDRATQIEQLCDDIAKQARLHADLMDQPRLVSIARKDRTVTFTFARSTVHNPFAMFSIETMAMLSDDTLQWARDCGFTNIGGNNPMMLMRGGPIVMPTPHNPKDQP